MIAASPHGLSTKYLGMGERRGVVSANIRRADPSPSSDIRGEEIVANGARFARLSDRGLFGRVRKRLWQFRHERYANAGPDADAGGHGAVHRSPPRRASPLGIALGADGNLWFTEFTASKIGQLNLAGKISESVTPSRGSTPNGIASGPGPNLNLWFTETKRLARSGRSPFTDRPTTNIRFRYPRGPARGRRARSGRQHVGDRPRDELGLARPADQEEAVRNVHAIPPHR